MNNKNTKNYNKNKTNFSKQVKLFSNKVLRYFAKHPTKSFNHKQIASRLQISSQHDREIIKQSLAFLVQEKKLKETQPGKYKFLSAKIQIQGKLDVSRRGHAQLLSDEYSEPIFISPRNLNNALHGDTVKVQLYASRKSRQNEGEVIKIIKRARESFAGIIESNNKYAFFMPDDLRIPYDIFIPLSNLNKAKSGDKVIVKITEWSKGGKNPTGEVIKVLGKPGEHEAEMHAILVEFGLPFEFSKEVLKEAENISENIPDKEIKNRRDFRNELCFTVDPTDAKDFDDAISYKKLKNGNVEIGIHIADVTHYVKPGSLIEQEAQERATSVYLVDRVVPMLPERLSNNICSLQENKDKLCFSAVYEINKNAKVIDEWYGKTIIKSKKRFDYIQIQEIIESGEGEFAKEILEIHEITTKLRNERFERGAFNFESTEVKFNLDENGKPINVYFVNANESNFLIEELMLLANRKVAYLLSKSGQKSVYRIHDEPNPEKIGNFFGFIKQFGYSVDIENITNLSQSLNKLIHEISGKPEQNMIESLAIKTMAKAEYNTDNIGHYGLAFTHYTHFTSPIRRYPDIMVHRLLERYLTKSKEIDEINYEWQCKHSSDMENKATQAERASIKYKQAEFLSDKIGEIYDGVISGVTSWGFFVEIVENKCEGLVHINTLLDDFYFFDEDNHCIIGKTTKRKFVLGDKVKIEIVKVNISKKQIDMELA